MKKLIAICAAALVIVPLAGCDDASAKLDSANEPVVTIGGKRITKGQLYSSLMTSVGESTAINHSWQVIEDQEIETTDEMLSNAQSTLSGYKMMYGEDTFNQYLESTGMSEDDYINNVILVSTKKQELYKKYIEENFDTVVTAYNPIKATILTFTSSDDANAAVSGLKDGSTTVADVISQYSLSDSGESQLITIDTTSIDTIALSYLRSASVDDGWQVVPGSSEDTWYVLRLDSNTPADYRDEFIDWAYQQTSVQNDATTYWFKKYNFHVYDIDLYNAVASADPNALVQAIADPTPTPEESASASASASADAN
jgi:foldase protein PrsA